MQEIMRHTIDRRVIREWNIIRKERLTKLEEKYEWDVKNIDLYARTALEVKTIRRVSVSISTRLSFSDKL